MGAGGRGVLSQLLVHILAQAVRRPAGQGSHTGEMCVAISDTHIITHAAQLLTVWRGRGPRVKLLTTGRFRLDALNLLIPGKFDAMLSAFSFIGAPRLQAELRPASKASSIHTDSAPGGLFSSCGCNYPPFRPLSVSGSNKDRGLLWSGCARRWGGGICLLSIWRALQVSVSKQLKERETQRATSASVGFCRADHKQSLPSLEEVESINNPSRFGEKML